MTILVWWVLPAVATLVAVCWTSWVRRPPRQLSDGETIDRYARFRAALATPSDTDSPPAGNSARSPAV